MDGEDEYAEAEAGPDFAPLPSIPSFFRPDDLPEWLRPTTAIMAPPAIEPRGESRRARQAWGLPDDAVMPAEAADFEVAAATSLTRLVPSSRAPKKRRGLFGLGAALALVVGAA